MTTRKQLNLKAIAGDDARVKPFVAALEGTGEQECPSDGASRDPQFTASGKNVAHRWTPQFTASGKSAGKSGIRNSTD
jgi:hypothetical protein